ncbi:MAG: 2-oxoacid ferredoxin oxidoreductase, partial [Chloroflexota bacterium]|nr:2-oxoacid ferredoxin oxidoreductase [Chloroflexota bacterium]
GFALVDVFSPCVTFNLDNSHDFFKQRVSKLEEQGHDPRDWKAACERAMEWGDTINIGLFFQGDDIETLGQREPVLEKGGPIAHRDLAVTDEQREKIVRRMM